MNEGQKKLFNDITIRTDNSPRGDGNGDKVSFKLLLAELELIIPREGTET